MSRAFSCDIRRAALLFGAFCLEGCFTAHYLAQATRGQLEILEHRRPLDDVIRDPTTPAETRVLLEEVDGIKRFAAANGLAATKNYSRYTDLKREAAVWVVSASERLAFRSVTWWFPITGSVPYLGWFRFEDAARFAFELQQQGLDVNVRTASAYSTLGFFEDPILSTMLGKNGKDKDALLDLANTILHESLHATFYVPARTDLSESVASFVGDELTRDYLDVRFGKGSQERQRYEANEARGKRWIARMLAAKAELTALYAADDPDKLRKKGLILTRLRADLKLKHAVNNATLAELHSYSSGQEELAVALRCVDRDWPRFLALLRAWAKQPKPTFATLGCGGPSFQGSK